ncbi:MAG: hypothetical protein ABSG17_06090 [Spirochaetia bacterium]|jgi:hypothetical protein
MTASKLLLGILPALALAACLPAGGQPEEPRTTLTGPTRAVRLDYENMARSLPGLDSLEKRLISAHANTVALGAGRPDWTYFKWRWHRGSWSSDVRDTAVDFLRRDARRFGRWAEVDAVVDVLAPRYVSAHPGAAAVSWRGVRSKALVSTTQLVNGEPGNLLVEMVGYIAGHYPVNSVSLTELDYYIDGYGEDDAASYRLFTGRTDWPRSADGSINIDDPSIGTWRSHEVGLFLKRAASAAHAHGKRLYLDVQVEWDHLERAGSSHGQDYAVMLESADRLVVWDYFGLAGRPAGYTTEVARSLLKLGADKVILSVGLWPREGSPISPDALTIALRSGLAEGISHQWVTPSRFLTEDHWRALARVWTSPER